jgi:site-specific recombinase XerC
MLYNKEDMKRIQAWLGHSTIAITADTYSHLEFQSKVDSGDLISDSLLIKKEG